MRVGPSRSKTRKLIAALALAALSLRALIPAGFMPAPGRLFALELCPDGLPSNMLPPSVAGMSEMSDMSGMPGMDQDLAAAQTHGHRHAQIEHCVFGGASALALLTHAPALDLLLPAYILPAARFTPQRRGSLLLRIPLPRGPPAPA